MSVSGLMTAVVEYVADVLVNECGRPEPDRVLRYFGTQGLPQDCCTEAGVLSIAWDRGYPSKRFPGDSSGSGEPCPGMPTYPLTVHYDVCWKAPPATGSGIQLLDDAWDADAAMLAETADCVMRALIRLSCNPNPAAPLMQAIFDELAGPCAERWAFREVTPNLGGGCARLTWKAYASPNSEPLS